jgi:transcriptional regulator with XRE-family HTH domain
MNRFSVISKPAESNHVDILRTRRIELGSFLRHRRTRLKPEDIGLEVSGRRHVRGLRRDEVAQAANIGISWYTMLEQGNVENVGAETINAIAGALRLTFREREYMRALAVRSFEELHVDAREPSPALVDFVRSFTLGAAFIHSGRHDVVAWNDFADEFFNFSAHGPEPNLLRIMLTDSAVRARFEVPGWNEILERMLGGFRNSHAALGDTSFENLISELSRYDAFARLWEERPLSMPPCERQSFVHPKLGTIECNVMAFTTPSSPTYTIILMTVAKPAHGGASPAIPAERRALSAAAALAVRRRRRVTLGAFLRDRRERMRPADIGLTSIGRRHVKGLRRDEVADLAGIGISWYAMLEQGRVENITPTTLNAIAGALKLGIRERQYLRNLAADSFAELSTLGTEPNEVLLEFVRTYPLGHAHFHDGRFDLYAWNDMADELYEFSKHARPNLLEIMTREPGPQVRHVSPNWRNVLDRMLAHFRFTFGQYGDAHYSELIDRLCEESPAFRDAWSEPPTIAAPPAEKILVRYEERGLVELQVLQLIPYANPSFVLILKNIGTPA